MKLEKLQPGMVVYDVKKASGLSRVTGGSNYDYWPVKIIEIDLQKQMILISHNGNPSRWTSVERVSKYRKNPPKSN